MDTQYPKIEEDNEFPMCYPPSKTWKSLEIWTTMEIDSVATIPPELKPGKGLLSIGLQIMPHNLSNMQILTSKIRGDTTLQR
jgi:hypothetical protein